jgi:hypothetical protein
MPRILAVFACPKRALAIARIATNKKPTLN